MNKYLFIFFILIALPCQAQEWTKKDTILESTYLILHTADWSQTRYIANHPDLFGERNFFLGKHPSEKEVNRYFVLTGLLHAGISYYLPDKWRQGFQFITIGFEAGVVAKNYHAGVKFNF